MANNVAYALAVEKLISLEIPERGKYIKVIIAEKNTITFTGNRSACNGYQSSNSFSVGNKGKRKILDLYDVICGARFTTSYTRIGGVAQDISDEALAGIKIFIDDFIRNLNEIRDIVERNKIFIVRCEGIGHLSKEDSIELGLTGPYLRACGVERDLRVNEPYLVYDKLNFNSDLH